MLRLRLAPLVSAALTLVACSGGGGTSLVGSSGSTGSTGGGSTAGTGGSGATNGSGTASSSTGGSTGSSGVAVTGGVGTSGTGTGGSSGGTICDDEDQPCALDATSYGDCCLGLCTDALTDPDNCGECYQACQPSQLCVQGNCTYPNCDGAPNGSFCAGNQGSQDATQECVDGICVAVSCEGTQSPTACALSEDAGYGSCCAGQCSAFDDPTNCGGCGLSCATGASCVQGSCTGSCADAGCPAGTVCTGGSICLSQSCAGANDGQSCAVDGTAGQCCGQICFDTDSDRLNCGECGNVCQAGTVCLYGSCQTTVASCATAAVGSICQEGDGGVGSCCGGCGQLDFDTDPSNCGQCGQICPQGSSCVGGSCAFAAGGFAFCGPGGTASCPAGDGCLNDGCVTESCGAGNAMEPCLGAAGAGACCGAACVDLSEDSANCGVCGTVCPTGTFCSNSTCIATPTCEADNSGASCPLASNKDGVCCSGQCVDTRSDPSNCEGCGVACPVGESCVPSIDPPCGQADGGAGPSCTQAGVLCPGGTLCSNGECLPSACSPGSSGVHCAFGTSAVGTCCNGVCTDTTQDPDNCGSCGTTCPSGICYSSIGITQCLPSAGDGGTCPFCPMGSTCVGGSCLSAACNDGPFGNCLAADGNVGACCSEGFGGAICTDLTSDPDNCAGCGITCPAGQSCVGGACSGSVTPCGVGRRDAYCDVADAGTSLICCPGGGCTGLDDDPSNCGYCGNACQSGLACLDGQCVATSCAGQAEGQTCELGDGGYGGCCSSTCVDLSSPDDCGGCGIKCTAAEICVGACVVPQCTPTYQGAPCEVDAGGGYFYLGNCCGNGCTDLQTDPANCGFCSNSCGDGGCNGGNCQ